MQHKKACVFKRTKFVLECIERPKHSTLLCWLGITNLSGTDHHMSNLHKEVNCSKCTLSNSLLTSVHVLECTGSILHGDGAEHWGYVYVVHVSSRKQAGEPSLYLAQLRDWVCSQPSMSKCSQLTALLLLIFLDSYRLQWYTKLSTQLQKLNSWGLFQCQQ